MCGPAIRIEKDLYAIRIFFGSHLHVHVRRADLLAIHSWVKPALSIEYVLRGGSMITEYDSREKFELVLAGLDGAL